MRRLQNDEVKNNQTLMNSYKKTSSPSCEEAKDVGKQMNAKHFAAQTNPTPKMQAN